MRIRMKVFQQSRNSTQYYTDLKKIESKISKVLYHVLIPAMLRLTAGVRNHKFVYFVYLFLYFFVCICFISMHYV